VLRSVARVAEEVREGVAITDVDGTIIYVDDGWAKMHGYETPELLGRSVTIVHQQPEHIDPFVSFREEVFRREVYQIEDRHRRKDGSLFHVEARAAVLRDNRGAPAGITTITRDISERKQAEEALRESEARLRHAEERQRLLAEVGAVLAGALGAEQMLQEVARLAVPLLGDWCSAYLLDEEGSAHQVAGASLTQMTDASGSAEAGDPEGARLVVRVIRTGTPEMVNEPTVAAAEGTVTSCCRMVVPLTAHGAVLGALSLGMMRPGRRCVEDDLTLAQDLAHRAAMAVNAARLHHEAIRHSEALQQFVEQLIAAQEEERRRIAYDLHDGLAQVLVANH
jgi:PAS domain S-box-containing protein